MKYAIINIKGNDFVTLTDDNVRVEWPDGSVSFNVDPDITVVGDYKLATVVQDISEAPAGKVLKSSSVKFQNGKWREIKEYADAEVITTPMTKKELYEYSASKRWDTEYGSFSFSGMTVLTDSESRIKITGAREKAKADPKFTFDWKAGVGDFRKLTAAQIIAISDAVFEFVQSCFSLESIIGGKIEKGEITTAAEIDSEYNKLTSH